MLTEDWMMRQVEALARSIAYLVFQKEDTAYTPTGAAEDAEIDELYRTLLEKVNAGDIGGAEDLLYQRAEPEDRRYLELAVDFYSRLNDLSDEQLEQGASPGMRCRTACGTWRRSSASPCCEKRRILP